ncbi:MAG: molybdopterin molybdotransferase MoeA [Acidobacteriota bacterium]
MLSPLEAWARIEARLDALDLTRFPAEVVPRDSALGRVLLDSVPATVDQPPADVSAMDGFALAGDIAADAVVPIVGASFAGRPREIVLAAGEAARITTGGLVPPGADRIVPVERTEPGPDDATVRILLPPTAGAHIRRGGEIVRRGDALLTAGTRLEPAGLALLAGHGVGDVRVVRSPRVAVLVTGDEIVPPDAEPGPGQLRDSNSTFLSAACRSLGLRVEGLGVVGDDPTELRRRLARGLEADVLLVSGGVSMGELDLVEPTLIDLGAEILFERVAIQPGKPLTVAIVERPDAPPRWVLGLPGNPGSVLTTYWLYGRPLLRRLQGHADAFWAGALAARSRTELPATRDRDRFLTASLEVEDGTIHATPHLARGSHDTVAQARGNALLRVAAGSNARPPGSPCEVLPIPGDPAV